MKIYFIILFFFLMSCKNEKKKVYDSNISILNGEKKEFYENGNLKMIHIFKNGVKSDSSIYFLKNKKIQKILYYLKNDTLIEKEFSNKGKIISIGKTYKNKMIGKWKFYKTNGNLDKIIEYINLCGVQYVNQGWYFNNNHDTIQSKSNYFQLKLEKSKFKINEKQNLRFNYKKILSKDSRLLLYLSPEIDKNYCNINEVKMDSIYSTNNYFTARIGYASSGKKFLRGYIKEFYIKENPKTHKFISSDRIIYLDIPIVVE